MQAASWLVVWQYVCQDDYGNVDNSRWGFETACDQHFADKALHNDGAPGMKQNALHPVQETDFSFVQDVEAGSEIQSSLTPQKET